MNSIKKTEGNRKNAKKGMAYFNPIKMQIVKAGNYIDEFEIALFGLSLSALALNGKVLKGSGGGFR
jgi:hypothetical protein